MSINARIARLQKLMQPDPSRVITIEYVDDWNTDRPIVVMTKDIIIGQQPGAGQTVWKRDSEIRSNSNGNERQ